MRAEYFKKLREEKEEYCLYSETYDIKVRNQVYQLQALDKPEQTFFLLKRSEELLHTVTMNEDGKWLCDDVINSDDLEEIKKWIERLFM